MNAARVIALAAFVLATRWSGVAAAVQDATHSSVVRGEVVAGSQGVRLGDLLVAPLPDGVEDVMVAEAPAFAKTNILDRARVLELLARKASSFSTHWVCPEQVRITRKHRMLEEADLLKLLTDRMQKELVRDTGELELAAVRPWTPVAVPDDGIRVKVTEVPVTGINPNFVARFEVSTAREVIGQWQLQVTAKIWKDMLVTLSAARRGQLLKDTDIRTERRDLLAFREPLPVELATEPTLEFKEMTMPNQVILARSVRAKPVILRGRFVDAALQSGTLQVSLKVEALEDGAVGQTIKVRNPQTRKEFFGKVQSDQFIVVPL